MILAWLLIPTGILIIMYTDKVYTWTGDLDFAENFFGTGGTYTFIKLFGLLVTILAIMWITGGLQGILQATFGKFLF